MEPAAAITQRYATYFIMLVGYTMYLGVLSKFLQGDENITGVTRRVICKNRLRIPKYRSTTV